jgi:hypothetical protein
MVGPNSRKYGSWPTVPTVLTKLVSGAAEKTAYRVLDWFHISMRLRPIEQMSAGIANAAGGSDTVLNELLCEKLPRIRYQMWNGKWRAALNRMGRIYRATKRLLGSLSTTEEERVQRFRRHIVDLRDYSRKLVRATEVRFGETQRTKDIERSGRVCDEPFGQSENGQTSAHALVLQGRASVVAGSLRRPRWATGQPLPRVASEFQKTRSLLATRSVTAPMFDTVPDS